MSDSGGQSTLKPLGVSPKAFDVRPNPDIVTLRFSPTLLSHASLNIVLTASTNHLGSPMGRRGHLARLCPGARLRPPLRLPPLLRRRRPRLCRMADVPGVRHSLAGRVPRLIRRRRRGTGQDRPAPGSARAVDQVLPYGDCHQPPVHEHVVGHQAVVHDVLSETGPEREEAACAVVGGAGSADCSFCHHDRGL